MHETISKLIPVERVEDILPQYRDTPIGRLLEYHNLGRPLDVYPSAALLIGMCMDHRTSIRRPDNFAYIIRAGGANLRYSEFKVSFALGIGGARAIALVAHTNCGMVNLMSRRDDFVRNLASVAGWTEERAAEHFMAYAPMFEIENETEFVVAEAKRLRQRYPKVLVAPLLYRVEDGRLYHIQED